MANENPNGSQNNNRRNDQNDNKQKGGFPSWLILLAIVLAITIFSNRMLTTISGRNSEEVRYDQFLSAVNQDEVAEVTISNEDIRYVLRADKDKTFEKIYYTSVVPGVELTNLVTKMQKNGVEMTGDLGQDAMTTYLISYLLMPVVLFVILWLISRRIIKKTGGLGGFGGMGGIGKSKAKVYMEKETGVTVMHMAKECDAGDMILVKKQAIRPDETAEDLFKELAVLGADAIAEAIVEIQNGTAQRVPQDESQATYAPMLSRELSPIDWTRSSTQIIDQIRALIPWPCAAASILGANTKIFRAVPLGETKDAPGTLCARKKGIEAACGDGKSILITELQPDGGKRMAANAFLNGKRIAAGTVLDA